jgi:hypothetical protein
MSSLDEHPPARECKTASAQYCRAAFAILDAVSFSHEQGARCPHEHGLKNRLKIGRFHKNRSVLLVFSKSVGEFEKF